MSSELGGKGGRTGLVMSSGEGLGLSVNSKGTKPSWPALKNVACNLGASGLSVALGWSRWSNSCQCQPQSEWSQRGWRRGDEDVEVIAHAIELDDLEKGLDMVDGIGLKS